MVLTCGLGSDIFEFTNGMVVFFVSLYMSKKVKYFNRVVYKYLRGRTGQTMDRMKFAENFWMLGEVWLDLVKIVLPFLGKVDKRICVAMEDKIVQMIGGGVYSGVLFGVNGLPGKIDLDSFDSKLSRLSKSLYARMSFCRFSKRFPYRYVRAFRNRSKLLPVMIPICNLYSKLIMMIKR